jgi:nucleotide-binding universal stress UspA family protein
LKDISRQYRTVTTAKGEKMNQARDVRTIVVGVDGSEASVEALKWAQGLAVPLAAQVVALACWDYPPVYDGYVAMGINEFDVRAGEILQETVAKAFGHETPPNLESRLVQGRPRHTLIDASRSADMLVVGRRGHGGFGGLLLGSVSSACVAHAHCPVLVVHTPEKHR